ncbi:MAG: ATP-binding cassette domain-containing protein, partial [bacterium]|nr:ATP-binding cassette domain-containing protein [bacterium]
SELEYRNTTRSAGIEFVAEGNNPKKLLDAQHLTKSIKGQALFKDLKIRISPGSRIGILGPNGCGKSTLIRVLLGQEKADHGTVFRADQLNAAYFEQNRESLDPNLSLAKSLSPHGDQVIYRGRPIHVRGYLDRFLFSQSQMNMPVGQLSGGEQSRLLIARLMLKEANLLVLDEPTNDLDLGILSLLEDCLTEFEGAVLLVTHDRFFLDRVANQILAFHPAGDGRTEYFSSLSQWEEWHEKETKSLEKIKKEPGAAQSAPVKKKG